MNPVAGTVSPHEAFWLLGEETRLAILLYGYAVVPLTVVVPRPGAVTND